MPRRPDLPCAGCGKLIWRGGKSLPAGQAQCRECRNQNCGTSAAYRRGCRCDECRGANTAAQADYTQVRRQAGWKPVIKPGRNKGDRYHLRKGQRQQIYERDAWVCQLCLESVDSSLPPNDRMAATLDHIEPQSLNPSRKSDSTNLRLAHRVCNARRGNRVEALEDADDRQARTASSI